MPCDVEPLAEGEATGQRRRGGAGDDKLNAFSLPAP